MPIRWGTTDGELCLCSEWFFAEYKLEKTGSVSYVHQGSKAHLFGGDIRGSLFGGKGGPLLRAIPAYWRVACRPPGVRGTERRPMEPADSERAKLFRKFKIRRAEHRNTRTARHGAAAAPRTAFGKVGVGCEESSRLSIRGAFLKNIRAGWT